jgi:hypothetical protein
MPLPPTFARKSIAWACAMVCFIAAGCAATTKSRPARDWLDQPLGTWRTPTVFVRIFGWGKPPPLTAATDFEVCVDLAKGQLVDVRRRGTDASADDPVAAQLRTWKWGVLSSVPLGSGAKCWTQRFTIDRNDKGESVVRTDPQTISWFRLVDESGELERVFDGEGDDAVATIQVQKTNGVLFVVLAPWLSPEETSPTAPSASSRATDAGDPHLAEMFTIRRRPGTALAVYRVCVDGSGSVSAVLPLVPLLGKHAAIMSQLHGLRFAKPPFAGCTMTRIDYPIK